MSGIPCPRCKQEIHEGTISWKEDGAVVACSRCNIQYGILDASSFCIKCTKERQRKRIRTIFGDWLAGRRRDAWMQILTLSGKHAVLRCKKCGDIVEKEVTEVRRTDWP